MIQLDPIICQRLCVTLLHSLWEVTLLAILATAVRFALGPQRDRHAYWTHVGALAIGLFALPLNYQFLSGWPTTDPVPTAQSLSAATERLSVTADAQTFPSNNRVSPLETTEPSSSGTVAHRPTIDVVTPESEFNAEKSASWMAWVVAIYFVGVVIMLVRLIRSAVLVDRLRSATTVISSGPIYEAFNNVCRQCFLKIAPVITHGEQVVVPKVVGLLKPTILLPTSALTGLKIDELELILAHELAHVRRHDLWIVLFQRFTEAVLFFNPAVWWLSRRISLLREFCCDDVALEIVPTINEPRLRYAEALVQCVRLSGVLQEEQVPALAFSGRSPSELRSRVARMLGEPIREPLRLSRLGIFMLLLCGVALAGPWFWASGKQSDEITNEAATKQLHSAVIFNVDQIDGLIKNGAAINDADGNETTPLWKAVRYSKVESVKKLLAAGADPDIPRKSDGWTPLICNAFVNKPPESTQIAKLLLDRDAKTDVGTRQTAETSLHFAVRVTESPELVELLLEAGADVNVQDSKGSTPLQFAVSKGKSQIADLLLTNGADPEIRNESGFRPIDQINATRPEDAKRVQAVFRSHEADSQRRPDLIRSYLETQKQATVSGTFVFEDGETADVEAQLYYNTRLENGNGMSGAQELYRRSFSFRVGAGTTWLTCYAKGYAPSWTDKIELAGGESRDNLKLVLTKGTSQSVRVVDEQGSPIAGARIHALPKIHGVVGGPVFKKSTNALGEHVFEHLANTPYEFWVEADGFEELRKPQAKPSADKLLTLTMERAEATTGVVISQVDGAAMVGAKIRLLHAAVEEGPNKRFSDSRSGHWWGEEFAVTDATGQFTLNQLTHGAKYYGVVEATDGSRIFVRSIKAGQTLRLKMPKRRDLIVEYFGDFGDLKTGDWAPHVSVRQSVRYEPWPQRIHNDLIGQNIEFERTPSGARAILKGLAFDSNSTDEPPQVRVSVPRHQGSSLTVTANPSGTTRVAYRWNEDQKLVGTETNIGPDDAHSAAMKAQASVPAAGRSLLVELKDVDGNPISDTRVRVYDGNRYFGGQPQRYKMKIVKTDTEGLATFTDFFNVVPEKAGYWIQVFREKNETWRSPNLSGVGMKLSRTGTDDRLVHSKITREGFRVAVTLRQECPTDIKITDAITGKRRHFAQLFFKDDRVDDWTLAALQDYVGDPGGDDSARLGLNLVTTMVPEMSDAQFMATREGYYPVEFRLLEKLNVRQKLDQRINLQPAPLIELTVLDVDGNPVKGAKLKYIGPDKRGAVGPSRPTNGEGRTVFLYPELGRMARYQIVHQDVTGAFAMSDLPAVPELQWKTGTKPKLGVTDPNFQTDGKRWALIRHTIRLRSATDIE